MAKLKTRTNQPVTDSEGLLEHLAQEDNTTQVGGHLEVDGDLNVNSILNVNGTATIQEDVIVDGEVDTDHISTYNKDCIEVSATLYVNDVVHFDSALSLEFVQHETYSPAFKTPYTLEQVKDFILKHRLSVLLFYEYYNDIPFYLYKFDFPEAMGHGDVVIELRTLDGSAWCKFIIVEDDPLVPNGIIVQTNFN